jgi:hypothetical protein
MRLGMLQITTFNRQDENFFDERFIFYVRICISVASVFRRYFFLSRYYKLIISYIKFDERILNIIKIINT